MSPRRAKPRKRRKDSGASEEQRERWRRRLADRARELERDFSKGGTKGKIPRPVIHWLDRIGTTPDDGKPFIIDPKGGVIDPTAFNQRCPWQVFVAFHDRKPTKRACEDVDFYDWVTSSAEQTALAGAELLMKACEADGCQVDIQVVYEHWSCYRDLGRSIVYCEVVLKIECLEL